MHYDVAIIGGGVAGTSVAAFLAPDAHVVLIEAEASLSHHASGRSAAVYTECYGPGAIPLLTKASRGFFTDRDTPLASPRGLLFAAPVNRRSAANDLYDRFRPTVQDLQRLDHGASLDLFPALDPATSWVGVHEPGAMDLDIHGLETAYRSAIRANGSDIVLDAPVSRIRRARGGPPRWELDIPQGPVTAGVLVDAAGAWGDEVAMMAGVAPLGLTPLRRSAFLSAGPPGARAWPMVVDVDERWYVKPEGPNLLGSAADERPSEPVDARPEEIEVARAIDRINEATTLDIRHVSRTWAGLRTFTPDRLPAVGRDPNHSGFFWLVGQGGYGIKTSPAIAEYATGLIIRGSVPERLSDVGITESTLSPARFR